MGNDFLTDENLCLYYIKLLLHVVLFEHLHALIELCILMIFDEGRANAQAFLL